MTLVPIDFQNIAQKSGLRRGRIAYSSVFESWCVFNYFGEDAPDCVVIEAPEGAQRIVNGRYWECASAQTNEG